MASFPYRLFSRYLPRSASSLRASTRQTTHSLIQPAIRGSCRGLYSSSSISSSSSSSSSTIAISATVFAVTGGGAFLYYTHNKQNIALESPIPSVFKHTKEDYQKVYDEIARLLVEKDDYDDGSYGPVVVRLAWHCSGTYDAETGTGGSNGATMRFAPEKDHGANAGLQNARDFLEPVKEKFTWITYSDLWTLAGITALQEMQGPATPWRPGRSDHDISFCTPDGRLPDGAKGSSHLRAIFGRMGFDDREIVALSGAHALGRCHPDRSGYDGPWDFSPTVMTNEFFRLLAEGEEQWEFKKWNGPQQYTDKASRTLMMLPTDMALMQDEEFKKHVVRYAKDGEVFFKEFADVFVKLLELGVPFQSKPEERWVFRTLEEGDDQEEEE